MDNPNDVKELIPEFFYFPEFLENQNGKLTMPNILIAVLMFFREELLQPFVNAVEHFLCKLYSVLVEITLIIMLASDCLMKTSVVLSNSLNVVDKFRLGT